MADIKKALLFINLHKANARLLAEEIRASLKRSQIDTVSCAFTNDFDFQAQGPYDIALTLGGDGTVLYAARSVAPLGVPILPINLGTLGFIAPISPEEWALAFTYWREDKIGASRRLMLSVTLERNGGFAPSRCCLNEAVISSSGIAKIVRLRVESDYMRFGKYRSDGLIVATPTGSTAYSLSAGGPILDPELEAIIVNPICPFTLSNRPIVAPVRCALTVIVEGDQKSDVLMTLDGQVTEPLAPGDRVHITRAPFEARLIAADRSAFYHALRTKLAWAGGPDA
ncbi:MAG: NAD(+)/NADH kinase [Spirochaetaceae bacterium]|jgi:NAD+ kinase|nr:NAD(+)/NADH kinase [Spirochaetaceae bacterium]